MINLDPALIDSGRLRLQISLGILVLLSLTTAALYYFVPSLTIGNTLLDGFTDALIWEPLVVLVMGLGTLQGGKAVRYIFTAIMVVLVLIQVELIYSGLSQSLLLTILFVAKWIATLLVIYFMIIDKAVNQYFLYQRAKNYGEWMGVKVGERRTEAPTPAQNPEPAPKITQPKPPKPEKKKKKSDWEEDLDLYE